MLILAFSLFAIFVDSKLCFSSTTYVVNTGDSIQAAINNANNGDTILISGGEHIEKSYPIIVNKSLTIVGENTLTTIINGNGTDRGIFLVNANDVKIGKLIILNTTQHLWVSGIHVKDAQRVIIFDCIVRECGSGVQLTNASNCNIWRNNITFSYSVGIYLHGGSTYNIIRGNVIFSNPTGLFISDIQSSYNKIFHNSFIDNGQQQSSVGISNQWDDSYPSGGNFWSDHQGADYYHGAEQNISGGDGIVDVTYKDLDRYPLLAPPTFFKVYSADKEEYYVVAISNASISNVCFNPEGRLFNFTVHSFNVGTSFLRISIPKTLLWTNSMNEWLITINGTLLSNPFIFEDDNSTYFYINFVGNLAHVEIRGTFAIPEFSKMFIWTLFSIQFYLIIFRLKIFRRRLSR
jgi:parallel beta-helix repeat protein